MAFGDCLTTRLEQCGGFERLVSVTRSCHRLSVVPLAPFFSQLILFFVLIFCPCP